MLTWRYVDLGIDDLGSALVDVGVVISIGPGSHHDDTIQAEWGNNCQLGLNTTETQEQT